MKDYSCSEQDLNFKHPFTCIISGTTGSGKLSFCIRLLQNIYTLCTEPKFSGSIVWCYSEKTAMPARELALLKRNISYCHGMPTHFGNARRLPSLIILDDLLNEAYFREVFDLFTKTSHLRNFSVILTTQIPFYQGKDCRDISLNAKYSV
jgi:hypothetical protein